MVTDLGRFKSASEIARENGVSVTTVCNRREELNAFRSRGQWLIDSVHAKAVFDACPDLRSPSRSRHRDTAA